MYLWTDDFISSAVRAALSCRLAIEPGNSSGKEKFSSSVSPSTWSLAICSKAELGQGLNQFTCAQFIKAGNDSIRDANVCPMEEKAIMILKFFRTRSTKSSHSFLSSDSWSPAAAASFRIPSHTAITSSFPKQP